MKLNKQQARTCPGIGMGGPGGNIPTVSEPWGYVGPGACSTGKMLKKEWFRILLHFKVLIRVQLVNDFPL